MKSAIAIGAHPDDIEFYMAGTLLLLRRAGWEVHYLSLASGNCGSIKWSASKTRGIRRREARQAAKLLDAQWHPPLCDDLEILYELKTLRRLAAVIRKVKPAIVLTHSPQDYMEDHMNACRLAATAAFVRGMPNFKTVPARRHTENDVTVYHAMPHGLRDGLRRRVVPELFVNTTSVHVAKRQALACHRSQKEWLDVSQGMDSYLQAMGEMSLAVGGLSGRFEHAEGWRRHLHLGLCSEDADPLRLALGARCKLNPGYKSLRE
jgi:LmbE family N-acetylglucosaminyl deacetylase